MKEIMDFLKEEGISPKLIQEVQEFSAAHPVKEELNGRIPVPHFYYYGKKVWEEALAALLCGKNLLLSGEKATGKNVLAENLAAVFGRPAWDISFHVIRMRLRLSARILSETGRLNSDQDQYTAVRAMEALVYSMRSIWQEMKHLQFCILHWISGGL